MRLLQARGWTVASIPFFEWRQHRGLAAQQQYLRSKLPQVCTSRPCLTSSSMHPWCEVQDCTGLATARAVGVKHVRLSCAIVLSAM